MHVKDTISLAAGVAVVLRFSDGLACSFYWRPFASIVISPRYDDGFAVTSWAPLA
jgi:hypothetical protein